MHPACWPLGRWLGFSKTLAPLHGEEARGCMALPREALDKKKKDAEQAGGGENQRTKKRRPAWATDHSRRRFQRAFSQRLGCGKPQHKGTKCHASKLELRAEVKARTAYSTVSLHHFFGSRCNEQEEDKDDETDKDSEKEEVEENKEEAAHQGRNRAHHFFSCFANLSFATSRESLRFGSCFSSATNLSSSRSS
mmetsp:Transcript_39016/g.58889  ORF Transcript_39016/g.58889 Transcript_39016/m.58889 type:complete len:194 (-) Transcript_39016:466-1047(-)